MELLVGWDGGQLHVRGLCGWHSVHLSTQWLAGWLACELLKRLDTDRHKGSSSNLAICWLSSVYDCSSFTYFSCKALGDVGDAEDTVGDNGDDLGDVEDT